VATWEFPTGVFHRASLSLPFSDRSKTVSLRVDASGTRVDGAGAGLSVTGAVIVTLLGSGVLAAAAALGVPAWRRHRLQAVVDARWRDLTHHWWEDL
jgi:hypothetical protein